MLHQRRRFPEYGVGRHSAIHLCVSMRLLLGRGDAAYGDDVSATSPLPHAPAVALRTVRTYFNGLGTLQGGRHLGSTVNLRIWYLRTVRLHEARSYHGEDCIVAYKVRYSLRGPVIASCARNRVASHKPSRVNPEMDPAALPIFVAQCQHRARAAWLLITSVTLVNPEMPPAAL